MEPENLNTPRYEQDEFDLRHFLGRYLPYWWLYALALPIAIGTAWFLNWYQNPVYAITAKVMVKDSNPATDKLLQQLNMDQPVRNIENEIEILRSHSLMAKVLNALDFDVSYYLVGSLKTSEVYHDCPFRVSTDQLPYAAYFNTYYVDIIDSSRFVFSQGKNREYRTEARWGEPFDGGAGTMILHIAESFPALQLADPNYDKRRYSIRFNTLGYNQNKYLSKLQVGLARPQSTMLQLYVQEEVPQKGVDFLNKLVELYLDSEVEDKNRAGMSTAAFLDSQLESLSTDLEEIETNRERFKVSRGIIDLSSESQLVLESIRDADAQRSQNAARLGMIGQLERYVAGNQDVRDLAPAALDINDPLLLKLISKLSELQSQREIITRRSTASDPTLVPLNAEIELTRASLIENIRNIEKGLRQKDTELSSRMREYRARIQRIPTTERELLEIERRFRIQESLYLYLLQKRAELAISLSAARSDNRLIDPARMQPDPVAPIPAKAYSIALVLAMLLPTLLIVLLEKVNDRISDLAMLRRMVKIPLLGVVRYNREAVPLRGLDEPRSQMAEEYRNIRTNLNFMHPGGAKVVMVTSSVGGEGKTFTAINLAAMLAAAGHKVVLVGLDLRKPRIIEHFSSTNDAGCSTVLSGIHPLEDAIVPTAQSVNLWLLPSGPVPPNPGELITAKAMQAMMNALTTRFDKVVIDTPPVALVSDALLIAPYSDTVVYIVREGVTRRDHIKYLKELIHSGKLNHAALVYNAAQVHRLRYTYGPGYGYGYSYGAEYGVYMDDEPGTNKPKKH
jgi:capsular exopolysaccharide synthesis family protein